MRTARTCFVLILLMVGAASSAAAQVQITLNPDVNFTLGVLGQFQADWLEDPIEDDTQQNLIRAFKITPVFQFTNRDVLDTAIGDESRWSLGLNYWWAGHNANIKGAWGRIDPRGLADQNQFTIQLQLFYF